VQCSDRRGFGRAVDEVVEPFDQTANAGLAAEEVEGSWRGGCHAESYCGSVVAALDVDEGLRAPVALKHNLY